MSTDKSGIRIKRVGPDEETAALPTPAEAPSGQTRSRTGTRARTTTSAAAAPSPAQSAVTHDAPAQARDDRPTGWQDRLSEATRRETKPFFLTSEFLLTVASIVALLVAGYASDDSLNAWRTWLLVTVIAAAYVLSRGIAKAGSSDRR